MELNLRNVSVSVALQSAEKICKQQKKNQVQVQVFITKWIEFKRV